MKLTTDIHLEIFVWKGFILKNKVIFPNIFQLVYLINPDIMETCGQDFNERRNQKRSKSFGG